MERRQEANPSAEARQEAYKAHLDTAFGNEGKGEANGKADDDAAQGSAD